MTENSIVQTKPKRRKIFIIISVAAVVFSVPVIVNIPNFRGMLEARKVFEAYHNAIIAKDYAAAYNFLAPETKANVSYEKFLVIEDGLGKRVGALVSYSTSEMNTRGDDDRLITTIRATLRFERGSLEFDYVLKKEQGVWFIYKFDEL
jgi:hypothetical protein